MALSTKGPLLVVEDDGLIRMDLVDTLQDAGYPVLEAVNADEAWAILLETDVSALVTDIDMPGSMDGLELARRVCERWPDCKINRHFRALQSRSRKTSCGCHLSDQTGG